MGDALGAAALFERLGFSHVVPPLLDDGATGAAIDALVTDELTGLGASDSLVIFYAGHGGMRPQRVGERDVRTGYLIPVDAADEPPRVQSWIELDPWLRRISRLPPRHILVILDACFSGIALSSAIKWGRDSGTLTALPFAAANLRPSRLVITSALDDERAMDSGPTPGHSLFTGCLIEALTGGLHPVGTRDGRHVTIGSELGRYLRHRVQTYPGRPGWQQTPDLGSFDFDERGEMLIPLLLGDQLATLPPQLARGSADRIAPQSVATSPALEADRIDTNLVAGPADAAAADPPAHADALSEPSRTRRSSWLRRWGLVGAAMLIALAAALALRVRRDTHDATHAAPETTGPSTPHPLVADIPAKPAAMPPSTAAGVSPRVSEDDAPPAVPGIPPAAAASTQGGASAHGVIDPRPSIGGTSVPPASNLRRNPAAGPSVRIGGASRSASVRPTSSPSIAHDSGDASIAPAQPPRAAAGDAAVAPSTSPVAAREVVVMPPTSQLPIAHSAATSAVSPPLLCKTPIEAPRGATVIWNSTTATIPTSLLLPCGVEVTLTFREIYHDEKVKRWIATHDGKAIRVTLQKSLLEVSVTSSPDGATVKTSRKSFGTTPLKIPLPAGEASTLMFSLDGYEPSTKRVTPTGGDYHVGVVLVRRTGSASPP